MTNPTNMKEITNEPVKLNTHQRLLEVKKTVGHLRKESRNEQQKFNFVSSSQTIQSVREKMNEMGLLLIPSIIAHTKDLIPTDRSTMVFTELDLSYTWSNVDDPKDEIVIPWYGQGVDYAGEKGVGKALTYAEKYFILKFFNIATDNDDPDSAPVVPTVASQHRPGETKSGAPTAAVKRTEGFQEAKAEVEYDEIPIINIDDDAVTLTD